MKPSSKNRAAVPPFNDVSGYTHIEVESGPDDRGRYDHTRFWLDDYHPGHPSGEYGTRERGQCFFAPLPEGWTA